MKRRLAAILATDVVGYSRLIREDKEGKDSTLEGLPKCRVEKVSRLRLRFRR